MDSYEECGTVLLLKTNDSVVHCLTGLSPGEDTTYGANAVDDKSKIS